MTDLDTLKALAATIQRHPEWEIPALSSALGITPVKLSRTIKALIGISPKQWLLSYRMRCWRIALQEQHDVLDSALDHFGALSTAYRHAAHALGMSPASLRKGGAGALISFGIATTEWGPMSVAVTSMGVCWVCADVNTLCELVEIYPNARLVRRDEVFSDWAISWRSAVRHHSVPTFMSNDLWLAILQQYMLDFVEHHRARFADAKPVLSLQNVNVGNQDARC